MLTKNWKLTLIAAVALAAVAIPTLSEQQVPWPATQTPEIMFVALPATNATNSAELAAAEAFVYPESVVANGLAE